MLLGEVALVNSASVGNLHCAHGRDIETKQTTTDNRNGGDSIDVADLIHLGESLTVL